MSADATVVRYLIIPDQEGSRLLLVQTTSGWVLPAVEGPALPLGHVEAVNRAVRVRYGLTVATLRRLRPPEAQTASASEYYVLDNLDPDWQPRTDEHEGNLMWAKLRALRHIHLAIPEHDQMVRQWQAWREADAAQRLPWMRPGWFSEAANWMIDLAERLDRPPRVRPAQQRAGARFCLLRLGTAGDDLYLKAVPDNLSYEPVLTRVLALRYPQQAPDVLAVDVDRAWMLMSASGGRPLRADDAPELWEHALAAYAAIQLDLAYNTRPLIAVGVPDRHVDQIAAQVDHLLAELPAELSVDERQTLRLYASQMRAICYDLLDYHVPLTLGHGDLRGEKIIYTANAEEPDKAGFIFFDWSDCSITHPFFDLAYVLWRQKRQPEAEERLITAYLQAWRRYESLENLRKAFSVARVVSWLHLAMIYNRVILPSLEEAVRWEVMPNYLAILRQLARDVPSYRRPR